MASLAACICQICRCGQHRCPHKPRTYKGSYNNSYLTEYDKEFKRHETSDRRGLIRPDEKSLTQKDAKISGTTTHGTDYIAYPVNPLVQKPRAKYQAPQGAMNKTTEYKQVYTGEWVAPAKLIPPPVTKKDQGEAFNHATTNSTVYVSNPVTPIKLYKSKDTYEPPKEPFNAGSTAKGDFTDYGHVPVTPCLKPQLRSEISTEPLQKETSYRTDFTPQPLPKKYMLPKAVYTPSMKGFAGSTTQKSDFCEHPAVVPPQSIKQKQNKLYDTDLPFENSTTNRVFYKSWEVHPRVSRPPTVYRPSSAKLSDSTTFKSDYPKYDYTPPPTSLKPVYTLKDQKDPFADSTTKSQDYHSWGNVTRPPPISHAKKYEPPQEKFDNTSTFKAHYLGTHGARSSIARPEENSHVSSDKLESMTSYKQNYSGSTYKPCPAAPLSNKAKTTDFAFSHEDTVTGHRFFTPVPSSY